MTMGLGQQGRTFLPYLRGISPKHLRLGNLYINPLEPTGRSETERWEFMEDDDHEAYEKAIGKWLWEPEEPERPFSVEFEAGKARSMGFNVTELLNLNGSKAADSLIRIQGQSGRRIQIKKPVKFLEEVMKQPGIDEWVRTHATIVRKGKHGLNAWKSPTIWLVTGIQYITGGVIHTQAGTSNRIGGGAGADASLAAHLPPGTLKVKGEVNYENSNGTTTDTGHEDERIWAVHFTPISFRFGSDQDADLSVKEEKFLPKSIARFQLQEIPDLALGGIRSPIKKDDDPLSGPAPGLTGHVVVPDHDGGEDSDKSDRANDFVIDDTQYVADQIETDWERYNACKRWLKDPPIN